jgi:TonB family protein
MRRASPIRAAFVALGAVGAVGLLGLASARATAQEAPDVSAETFVRAAPVERTAPNYPGAALRLGQEGWVMLSYVISPEGAVTEPMIEDSSGVEALERAALNAVRKWRFSPATRNGVPVEQSMTKTRIAFQLQGNERGASSVFRRKYLAIAELVEAGDLASVPPLLDELEFGGRANLYEDAWFWWLKFAYLEASKSSATDEKIAALRTAVGYEEDYLAPDLFVAAAQRLYALEVLAQDYSAARNTFNRLREAKAAKRSKQYESALEALQPSYAKIEELIAGATPIASNAEISSHDYWVHDLLRRSFAMDEISGRVDVVDVRCERATKRYDTFPLDGLWRVPESWGDCGVYIKGEPGTTFLFVEYPAETPATTLSTD